LDGRWKVQPETDAVVGYSFSQVNYTGNELIAGDTLVNDATGAVIADATIKSESRDLREHRFMLVWITLSPVTCPRRSEWGRATLSITRILPATAMAGVLLPKAVCNGTTRPKAMSNSVSGMI